MKYKKRKTELMQGPAGLASALFFENERLKERMRSRSRKKRKKKKEKREKEKENWDARIDSMEQFSNRGIRDGDSENDIARDGEISRDIKK